MRARPLGFLLLLCGCEKSGYINDIDGPVVVLTPDEPEISACFHACVKEQPQAGSLELNIDLSYYGERDFLTRVAYSGGDVEEEGETSISFGGWAPTRPMPSCDESVRITFSSLEPDAEVSIEWRLSLYSSHHPLELWVEGCG